MKKLLIYFLPFTVFSWLLIFTNNSYAKPIQENNQSTKEQELKQPSYSGPPKYHLILDQNTSMATLNDGWGKRSFSIGTAKHPSYRLKPGEYLIDARTMNEGVVHFTTWGNPNLVARNVMALVPQKDGKPIDWPIKKYRKPFIHTEPQNCWGYQTLIAQGKDVDKYCPPALKYASKGPSSHGCFRLDYADSTDTITLVKYLAKKGIYMRVLVK